MVYRGESMAREIFLVEPVLGMTSRPAEGAVSIEVKGQQHETFHRVSSVIVLALKSLVMSYLHTFLHSAVDE